MRYVSKGSIPQAQYMSQSMLIAIINNFLKISSGLTHQRWLVQCRSAVGALLQVVIEKPGSSQCCGSSIFNTNQQIGMGEWSMKPTHSYLPWSKSDTTTFAHIPLARSHITSLAKGGLGNTVGQCAQEEETGLMSIEPVSRNNYKRNAQKAVQTC